jgi:hypothetical protein
MGEGGGVGVSEGRCLVPEDMAAAFTLAARPPRLEQGDRGQPLWGVGTFWCAAQGLQMCETAAVSWAQDRGLGTYSRAPCLSIASPSRLRPRAQCVTGHHTRTSGRELPSVEAACKSAVEKNNAKHCKTSKQTTSTQQHDKKNRRRGDRFHSAAVYCYQGSDAIKCGSRLVRHYLWWRETWDRRDPRG